MGQGERAARLDRNQKPVKAVELFPCDGAPPKQQRRSPASGAELTTLKVMLDRVSPHCVKTFSIVVRQGSKTGPVVFSKSKITQGTTPALAKKQTYFWQVTGCKGKFQQLGQVQGGMIPPVRFESEKMRET